MLMWVVKIFAGTVFKPSKALIAPSTRLSVCTEQSMFGKRVGDVVQAGAGEAEIIRIE
jgi:hypothetical protein